MPPRRCAPAVVTACLFLLLLFTAAAAAAAAPSTFPAPPWANLTGVVPGLDCPALVGPPPFARRPSPQPDPHPHLLPRALHFVWVGRRPLPPKYCANLASFAACLGGVEGWAIHLWMDGDAPAPACLPAGVAVRDAGALAAASPPLAAALAARPNLGYRADLVRYAVLADEGGVYSDIDATCLASPAEMWRTPFVAWTGDPYWNLSNAVFGFAARSPLASFVLACGLAHAPTAGPHAFIPDIAGPSFFTTAVRQAVESSGVEERGSGHAHTRADAHARARARARAHAPLVGHAAAAHHPSPPLVRLLPQPLFISGAAVGGVGPFTRQSNDYNWRE